MTTMDIGRTASAGPERRSFGLLAGIDRFLRRMARRHRQRETLISLTHLDEHLLRDIGIEPRDVYDALQGRNSSLLFEPIRRDHQ